MKMLLQITALILSCFYFTNVHAQNAAINNTATAADASAMLDVSSTSKGLLIPRMSTASITSISNPAKGLLVYDSVKNQLMVNMGTAALPDWQNILFKSGWSLTGNSGTDTAVNFIGTTTNMPLRFKVNNVKAGLIGISNGSLYLGYLSGYQEPPGFGNTGLGWQAFSNNKTGTYSTAAGTYALYYDTSFGYNTAIGSLAMLQNRSGFANTAVGSEALYYSKFGDRNTAVGSAALYADSSGDDNTAVGEATLFANRLGSYNVALGGYAMYNHIKSNFNTAMGYYALNSDTSGQDNAALGSFALYTSQNSNNNTAIGEEALYLTKDGSGNTGLGYKALYTNSTGLNNTAIGASANVGSGALTNATALGAGAIVNTSNSLVLGSNAKVGIGTSSPVAPLHINGSGTDAYSGIILSSTLSGGKQLSINQGTAGKLNFTNPGIIDLVTMDFNNNRVGINVTTPSHLLQLGNDDAFKPATSTWGVLSDRRLKENIDPFTDGLNVVLQMKPVWFNYNGLGGTSKGERAIGTVAQELQQLAPYMVSEVKSSGKEDQDAKYLGVNYHALFFVLVNAVKEQNKTIEDLKEENGSQKKMNEGREKQNDEQNKKIEIQQQQIQQQQQQINTLLKEIQLIKDKLK